MEDGKFVSLTFLIPYVSCDCPYNIGALGRGQVGLKFHLGVWQCYEPWLGVCLLWGVGEATSYFHKGTIWWR